MPTVPRKRLTTWPFLSTGLLPLTLGGLGTVVGLMFDPPVLWITLSLGALEVGTLSLVLSYLVLRDCEVSPATPYMPLLRWFFLVVVALALGSAMVAILI
jgi:hypothetical protein